MGERPNWKVRDVGQLGVIADRAAFDVPMNAFTFSMNVRFNQHKAMAAPIFRRVLSPAATNPIGVGTTRLSSSVDNVIIADDNGEVYSVAGSEVEITKLGFTPSVGTTPWSIFSTNQVLYVNRIENTPKYLGPADANLQELPDWDSGWRAGSLVSYKDFIVALNVTKGASEFPSMVKWSSLSLAGQPPISWDEQDPNSSAGENILEDTDSTLIDGFILQDYLIIFTETQVWRMEFIGGSLIFRFRKLFDDGGIVNKNCAIEVEGKLYVFGTEDIYVTDGVNRQSIAEGRVKENIFRTLKAADHSVFFVAKHPVLNEIYFCYATEDTSAFPSPTRCNRAAIYNWEEDIWSFMDLPNVAGMVISSISQRQDTYDGSTPDTYETIGGSYSDQGDDLKLQLVAVTDDLGTLLDETKIYTFQAIIFEEKTPNGEIVLKEIGGNPCDS